MHRAHRHGGVRIACHGRHVSRARPSGPGVAVDGIDAAAQRAGRADEGDHVVLGHERVDAAFAGRTLDCRLGAQVVRVLEAGAFVGTVEQALVEHGELARVGRVEGA